jgi:hypothetical protein
MDAYFQMEWATKGTRKGRWQWESRRQRALSGKKAMDRLDGYSPMPLTAIHESKHLFYLFIQLIFRIFRPLSPNTPLLQREVIPATTCRWAGPIGIRRRGSVN